MSADPSGRCPSYLSCASLARELECSESTVYKLVREGVLPKPVRLSDGTVRWCWAEVDAALRARADSAQRAKSDPYLEGVANVAKKA
jgi:predicted DNA-binding transcriptional regulator AlpA